MDTNYYIKIKDKLINNEVYKRVKDYSKNRSDLKTYYEVGKLLVEAGKHYGEGIIKEYSKKLTSELGKKYGITLLKYMRTFYLMIEKGHAVRDELSWTHYRELLKIKGFNEIEYYIYFSIKNNLSYRKLGARIKSNEYERLDEETKLKIITQEQSKIEDFIKNPILIKNSYDYTNISEKMLKQLIYGY